MAKHSDEDREGLAHYFFVALRLHEQLYHKPHVHESLKLDILNIIRDSYPPLQVILCPVCKHETLVLTNPDYNITCMGCGNRLKKSAVWEVIDKGVKG
mgnify:CR=1 FL=1